MFHAQPEISCTSFLGFEWVRVCLCTWMAKKSLFQDRCVILTSSGRGHYRSIRRPLWGNQFILREHEPVCVISVQYIRTTKSINHVFLILSWWWQPCQPGWIKCCHFTACCCVEAIKDRGTVSRLEYDNMVVTQSCWGQQWPIQIPITRRQTDNLGTTSTGLIYEQRES